MSPVLVLLLGLLVLCAAGCQRQSTVVRLSEFVMATPAGSIPDGVVSEQKFNPRLLRRFAPIGRSTLLTPSFERVQLGRQLFFEPLLSGSGTLSCNSCHPLDQYGTTMTATSSGEFGTLGRRNAPTVYNTAGQFRLFWDGRAATLEDQVAGPLAAASEMGLDSDRLERRLVSIPGYRAAFAKAFPGQQQPVTILNVKRAIAEFERGLNTPARWDQYLQGDVGALTVAEKEGARLFANVGCLGCHTGPYLGGATFEKVGRVIPWPNQTDHGRMEITHDPADDMKFKVPSLRNVAKTAPYFHDGSAQTLDAAVRKMAIHQLGMYLADDEVASIVTWLNSLTGALPAQYVLAPTLPAAQRP